jgi:hypothetical protein
MVVIPRSQQPVPHSPRGQGLTGACPEHCWLALHVSPEGQQVPPPQGTGDGEAQAPASGARMHSLGLVPQADPVSQHQAPQLTPFGSLQTMGVGETPQPVPLTQMVAFGQQPEPQTSGSCEGHWNGTTATTHMSFAHVAPVGQQLAPQPTGKFAGHAPPPLGATRGADANLTEPPLVKSVSRRRRPLLFAPPVVALFDVELPHPSAMHSQSALAHPIASVY